MHQHVTLKVRLGTTYKKTAVYSCMTGFTLKGSYRRTCGQTGQWSDDAPTCDIKGKAWYHLQEDPTVYSCMTGFTLKGSYRRTCGETGQWSDDAPTCDIKGKAWYHLQEDSSIQLYDRVHTQRIIQENMWVKLDSGVMMHQHVTLKVRLGTTYKKTAVYSCMTGFTLKGSYSLTFRTCGQTGQWSDDAPTCDIKGKAL